MAQNRCCRCSTFLSCFSCFSAKKGSSASPDVLISSAIVNDKADSQSLATEAGVKLHTQIPPSSSDAPTFIVDAVTSSSVEGASPAAPPNAPNHNTNVVSPIVTTQESLQTTHHLKIPPSNGHASSSAGEDSSSSVIPTIVKQDDPALGGSPSSTLQKESDYIHNIGKDVAAVDGDNFKVDLDGLMKHISELLDHIKSKEEGKKSSVAKKVQQLLPDAKSCFKLKDFLSEAANFLKDIVPGDARTMARGFLQNIGTVHFATTGLLVVANILERFEDVSNNRGECLHLLKEMVFLAKVVKQIEDRPQLQESMHKEVEDATVLIVEGSIKCCSQMASSQFYRFFSTSSNKDELGELARQLEVQYKHINVQMGIQIYDVSQYKKEILSRGYPENAVGLEEAIREVIDLLEWSSEQNAVAVILHGFGGMGKTTLADAVFSLLHIEECKYSMVKLFENIDSPPKITELQRDILRDLKGSENIPEIRKHENGQRELSSVLEDVTAFIYIDNALGERELAQLLPETMSKAKKVRLLITTRDLNVRKACPLKAHPKEYHMRGISSTEATNLLKREMFDDMKGLYSYQVSHIIQRCGGIPLMLKLVAKALYDAKDKQVDEVLDALENLKGEDFGTDKIEPYLFAYDKLPQVCQDPFLDICSFFQGWDWDIVANIVGVSELEMLARRALMTKNTNGVISVHDIILTLGRRKSEGVRLEVTGGTHFKEVLDEKTEEEIQKIKGIWFRDNNDLLPISATILDSMHKSLRILRLGNLVKIEGRCNRTFENLTFFQGVVPDLPFGAKKLEKLKYLSYKPKDLKLLQIPKSLTHMEFDGRSHSQALEISEGDLKQFEHLRTLRLTGFAKLKKLPEQLGDLVNGLQELTLSYCNSIEHLPPSISKLQLLRVLRMDYCSSLRRLPEGFGLLNSLQEINFQGCRNLERFPDSFEKLDKLRLLDFSSCEQLWDLPDGIENLTSLVKLSFSKCAGLSSIPESIGRLSSVFSIDMSCCSRLRGLPDLIVEFGNLTELNLSDCARLENLPKGFSHLTSLVKLNLSKCSSLKELCNEFDCLLSLEILDLSGCKKLQELPPDFHRLTSLENLYLSECETLRNLTEDFYCLPALQHLYLRYCPMLEGKWMDNLVKLKKLQIMNIQESNMLVKRWGEIQTEGNKSCSFVVYTGQDLSKEEKENILQKLLSELDRLLIDRKEKQFRISNHPPNTPVLVMFHSDPNEDFPFPLIEESIDDIQINFEMVYIGRHFNKLPGKVKDKFLAHSSEISKLMVVKLLLTLDAEVLNPWLLTLEKYVQESWLERYLTELPVCFKMEMMEDGKVGKYHPCWKVLSNGEMEEFVLSKCGRYIKLKKLKETSQVSNMSMLNELFATGDEEINQIFQKNCASSQDQTGQLKSFFSGIDKLVGKTILLEMRSVCDDTRLWSLREIYHKEKERLEIISVPIVQQSSILDVLEQFSKEVPWLVLQNPLKITRAVKYFLIQQCGMERDEKWYPGVMWIIGPTGEISTCKPSTLFMLNRWGPKAYPFTPEKCEELRKSEWTAWKNMSNLEFIFNHLESISNQVKEMMAQGSIICLYTGYEEETTHFIRNGLINLKENIHIIYIPQFSNLSIETFKVTDYIFKEYYTMKGIIMPQAEMKGMPLLNLSEYEAMRFWMCLFHLKEELKERDKSDNHVREMKRLLHSFLCVDDENDWDEKKENDEKEEDEDFISKFMNTSTTSLTFIKKDGKMVRSKKGEVIEWILKNTKEARKRWMQLLNKALKEEGKQTENSYIISKLIKNMQTVAADQENVDVDFHTLSEYTSHVLEVKKLYRFFEFNKDRENLLLPKATGQLYWSTSRGFSMYKDILTDGQNANWVKDIISQLLLEENEKQDEENRGQDNEYTGEDIYVPLPAFAQTMIKILLKEIGEAHWAAASLLGTAYLLERPESVYASRKEHQIVLIVLDETYRSAMCVNQFNGRPGLGKEIKRQMKTLMACTLLASMACCQLTEPSKFARLGDPFSFEDLSTFASELEKRSLKIESMIRGDKKGESESVVQSIISGDNKDETESESDSDECECVSSDSEFDFLFSEDESEAPSAKASPTSIGDEEMNI